MVNNVFLFLFISVLLVGSFASAQETLIEQIPSFQFNHDFDLKRTCSDRGFFCDINFVCNISLVSPNGEILINNELMTNNNSFRNITITQEQNNQLGFVTGFESCNNVTNAGLDTFTIAITGDGNPYRDFPHQFVVIIFGLILVFVGLINERFNMFKSIGSMILMVMGVLTLFPGYSFINYSTLMGKALGFGLIGLGFWFLIEDSFSRNKQQERFGQPQEDDTDITD